MECLGGQLLTSSHTAYTVLRFHLLTEHKHGSHTHTTRTILWHCLTQESTEFPRLKDMNQRAMRGCQRAMFLGTETTLLQVHLLPQLACCMTPNPFICQAISFPHTHTHTSAIKTAIKFQLGRKAPTFLRNPQHFHPEDEGSVFKMLASTYKTTVSHAIRPKSYVMIKLTSCCVVKI